MSIQGKRILLTGGAGFLGTSLAIRLVEANELVILDTLHRNALGDSEIAHHPNLTLLQGDVMDRASVDGAMEGVDMVVHLAAIAGVDTVMANPVKTMEVALIGTWNILESARQHGKIERFVDFSTSEVFGTHAYNVQEGDVTSIGAIGEARWTYAVSKLATEHLAHNYCKTYGLPTVSIRPFNIYGPRQVGVGAVHAFVKKALRNEPLVIHGGGSQIRAWCYIDDIIDAILQTLVVPEAVGEVFNIGNPRSVITVYQLAKLIIKLADSRSEIEFDPREYADIELRIPDIRKAVDRLGFSPKFDLEEGLEQTIQWYRGRSESR